MTQNDLDRVLRDINTAHGLPNAHYIDSQTFNEEKHSVLFAHWTGVGFGKDIPKPGDVKPINFLGMPLLLVRDNDGEVCVFQNTCRHRGMILIDKAQNVRGAIRCPYHSWCYSLKGDLRATPHVGGAGHNMHPNIDRATLGLIRLRTHIWRDVIFVNVDGCASDFTAVHADLLQRWQEFDQPLYHGGASSAFTLDICTNWKLAVENYCESYHLPWVHPGLNSYSRLEDHYNIAVPGLYSGQGSLVYRQLHDKAGNTMPDFAGLSAKWDQGAEYIAVYPNVLMGVQRDHVFAIVLEPQNCGHTLEHIALYYAQPPEETPSLEELRAQNAELWKTVFEEDIAVVEGMQRGRHGLWFDGGRFSPAMDDPTHHFHHWVATQIQQAREVAQGE